MTYQEVQSNPVLLGNFKLLLQSEDLCWDDLDDLQGELVGLLSDNGDLIGGFGLEIYGPHSLLRSVIVSKKFRNKGLGMEIMRKVFAYSKEANIKYLYLLTTTADTFFQKFGFHKIERTAVPATIAETKEFKSFCPDSAICMKTELKD